MRWVTNAEPMIKIRHLIAVFVLIVASGCALSPEPSRTLGDAVELTQLPGWNEDSHGQAWQAFVASCTAGKRLKNPKLEAVCERAKAITAPTDRAAAEFFLANFIARPVSAKEGRSGLITGYYAPLLKGSMTPTTRYQVPLYASPDDLITVELADLFPELKGKRVRGRVVGNKLVPYFTREEIDSGGTPLSGQELLWVDSAADAFFLQVQGSGRVRLEDGRVVGVGYANQNGQPYVSIGRELVRMNEIALKDVSLQSIRKWLLDNPDRAASLYNKNPSYVFFALNPNGAQQPKGSLAVPLTAERSIAIDRSLLPLGAPMWIDTTLPTAGEPAFRRLVMAQDTGGAIKGAVRADVFFGSGDRAELLAGNMKQRGQLWVLVPRP